MIVLGWMILCGAYAVLADMGMSLAQTSAGTRPAELRGKVVHEFTNEPLRDVVVSLTSSGGGTMTALTDQNGDFVMEDVRAGTHTLSAVLAGFVERRRPQPYALSLNPGQRLEVTLHLLPTVTIEGRVLTREGNPVQGARVAAVREAYYRGQLTLEPCMPLAPSSYRANTDENGNYRVYALEPGVYYLAVGAPGNCDMTHWYPNASDPAFAQRLDIRSGSDLRAVDFYYSDIEPETYDVFAELSLPEGIQMNPTSVYGVHLIRKSTGGPSFTFTVRPNSSLEKVGENRYRIDGVPAGSYEFHWNVRAGTAIVSGAFDIVDRDVDLGLIEMEAPVQLQGRIRLADGAVGEWDPAALRIRLYPVDGRLPVQSVSYAVAFPVRSDGSFETIFPRENLPFMVGQGIFDVQVLNLPSPIYIRSLRYGDADVLRGYLRVDGQAPAILDIEAAVGGSVEGRVQFQQDSIPAADVQVVLVPLADRSNHSLFRTTATDSSGRFQFQGVAPGNYTVMTFEYLEPDIYYNEEFLRVNQSRGSAISVQSGTSTTLNVTMPR